SPTAPYVDIAGPVADLSRPVPDPCLLRIPEHRPVLDLPHSDIRGPHLGAEPARRQLHDRVTGSKKGRPVQITNSAGRTSRRLGTLLMVRRSHATDSKPISPNPASIGGSVASAGAEAPAGYTREPVTDPVPDQQSNPAGEVESAPRGPV